MSSAFSSIDNVKEVLPLRLLLALDNAAELGFSRLDHVPETEVGERGLGGPFTTGTSWSCAEPGGVGARGWSATGPGEGVALDDGAGVELLDASPIANLARSLSSNVVLPAGRGFGAAVRAGSAAGAGETT